MSGIVAIKKKIRHALETPLFTAAAVVQVPVEWPDKPVTWTSPPPEKFKFGMGSIFVDVLELGENPRFRAHGRMSIVVCTRPKDGADRNDYLAGIVAAAYPYGATLPYDGFKVYVDKSETGDYAESSGYMFSPLTIMWNAWRRGNA